jgi:ABC-type sugar transport system ATPase subunit
MDEPTAALGVSQTELVLSLITRLASRSHGVIVISHNLNDVFQVADRIAVVYLGRMVAEGPAADFDRQSIVDLMTTGMSTRLGNGNGNDPAPSPGSSGDFGSGFNSGLEG